MSKYRLVFYSVTIIFINVLLSVGHSLANTVYTHPQTGISFPAEIDPLLIFVKFENYEEKEKGMGVGIRYESKLGIKSTIYLFNHGEKNIPNGTSSRIVKYAYKDALKTMKAMEDKGYYKNVNLLQDGTTSNLGIPFYSSKYSYLDMVLPEKKRVDVVSYIYVTGYKGYILKIRFTYLNDSPDMGEKCHKIFMNSVLKLIK